MGEVIMKHQIWLKGENTPYSDPKLLTHPQIHNEDGPAIIIHDDDGKLQSVIYMKNGKLHNPDGPAMVRYNKGKPVNARWIVDSVLHNTNGPAIIDYDADGKVRNYEYWILGKHIENGSVYDWAKNIGVDPAQMSSVAEHLFVMNFSPELMR